MLLPSLLRRILPPWPCPLQNECLLLSTLLPLAPARFQKGLGNPFPAGVVTKYRKNQRDPRSLCCRNTAGRLKSAPFRSPILPRSFGEHVRLVSREDFEPPRRRRLLFRRCPLQPRLVG